MTRVTLALVFTLLGYTFAFRPAAQASSQFWLGVSLPYLLLAAMALRDMWQDGTLVEKLEPRWGDLSMGALTAIVLLFASWAGRSLLAPAGTARQAWFWRIYLQLGNPEHLQHSIGFTCLILLVAAAEEIVWRGMVLSDLQARFGKRAGTPLSVLLYGLSLTPTLWMLRDPLAGPNPLLVTAALGCGLVWSFLSAQVGRLVPAIVSHMAFTYFSIVQFRWPGM
ncbi:MAG TPA: CPBP family intramembrane glutamic endopeptidase [Polyangiaceae bacterium]